MSDQIGQVAGVIALAILALNTTVTVLLVSVWSSLTLYRKLFAGGPERRSGTSRPCALSETPPEVPAPRAGSGRRRPPRPTPDHLGALARWSGSSSPAS
jgi:hypothetical protein